MIFKLNPDWKIILATFFCIGIPIANVVGQITDSLSSAATKDAMEQILYEIKLQRFQQKALYEFSEPSRPSVAVDIMDLLKEAKILADSGDFYLAGMLLDEADESWDKDLIEMDRAFEQRLSILPGPDNEKAAWERHLIVGSDFWQNRFDFAWGLQDSVISEGQGNPYIGLRFAYEKGRARQQFFSATLESKLSRDYFTGSATALGQKKLKNVLFEFKNHLEGNSFRDQRSARYWDESFLTRAIMPFGQNIRIEATQKLACRAYSEQTDFYTSFLEFETQLATNLQFIPLTNLMLKYSYRFRDHAIIPEKDFRENNLIASWLYGSGLTKSIYLRLNYRNRQHHTQVDTLYTRDYAQVYGDLEAILPLTSALALGMRIGLDWRQYTNADQIIPNYRELELEPALIYTWIDGVRLKMGYLHRERSHESFVTMDPSLSGPTSDVAIENYFSRGFVLGLDVLTIKGLMISLANTYEIRRYPNSVTREISDFSLYSDRNLNNLLLYLTWPITPKLELNSIANLDHDDDRKEEKNNSRITLFSLEFLYKF